MKNLAQQLAFYQAYHRTRGCKATHFIGVPLVTFSILIPLGWLGVSVGSYRLTLAVGFVAATLLYYFALDLVLAVLMTAVMIPLTWAADRVSLWPRGRGALIFLLAFVVGWIFQLVGHAIEGRRPALLTNFRQAVFTAPLFLMAEVLFALGWRKDLRERAAKWE